MSPGHRLLSLHPERLTYNPEGRQRDGRTDRWTDDGVTGRQRDGQINEWAEGWIDGWMKDKVHLDGDMDREVEGGMDNR